MPAFLKFKLCIILFLLIWNKETVAQQFNLQGTATQTGPLTYTITTNSNFVAGMVTNVYPLNLTQNFTLSFELNFGINDANGADGMAIVLSNVCNPPLTPGGGLGVTGISNSLIAEFDTWDNGTLNNDISDDHIGIYADGMLNPAGIIMDASTIPVCMLSSCGNVEDGQWYNVVIQWQYIDATTQRLSVFFNGVLRTTSTRNHILERFNNNNIVFWSLAGSTGGSTNIQQFRTTTANNNLSYCEGDVFTLTAPILGTNYMWSNSASTSNTASYTATTSGTITCTYIDYCNISRSVNFVITVNPNPVLSVNSPFECEVSTMVTATITAPGSYSYVWTVPTGAPNPGNVASFSTTIAGTYSVIATNTITGCISSSASGIVTFLVKPTVTLNSPTPICAGLQSTITASPGMPGTYSFSWTVPIGAINPGNVSSFAATINGTYSVTITNTVNGCTSNPASVNLVVYQLPVVSINNPQVCAGISVQVTATPASAGSYNYIWTVPAGVTNPGNVSSFNSNVNGNYSVQIINSLTGCVGNTAAGTVTIFSLPVVSVNSATVCQGSTALLMSSVATAGNYNYTWSVPTGVTNPGNVPSFSSGIAGNYSVVVQNSINGCNSINQTGVITVTPLQKPQFVAYPSVCSGSVINSLPIVSINGINGSWSPTINNLVSTFYTFTPVTGICADTASMQITIIDPPQVNLGPDQEICPGQQITLNPNITGTGLQYMWQDGSLSPFYNVMSTGNYAVTVTNQCGIANDEIQIKQGICKVYIPNAFTPNNDRLNDKFNITGSSYIKEFYMQIYNRWGQKLFETKDPYIGWDGKYLKIEQPAGVYVYRIRYTYLLTEESSTVNGTVTLLR